MEDELLSTSQYAAQYGVSDRTVRRWIENGQIFALVIGRGYKIPADEVPPITHENEEEDEEPVSIEDLENFEPEEVEDEEPDEEDFGRVDILDPADLPGEDLRRIFTTVDDAEDYAGDIPVPTQVFERANDGLFQVLVMYP